MDPVAVLLQLAQLAHTERMSTTDRLIDLLQQQGQPVSGDAALPVSTSSDRQTREERQSSGLRGVLRDVTNQQNDQATSAQREAPPHAKKASSLNQQDQEGQCAKGKAIDDRVGRGDAKRARAEDKPLHTQVPPQGHELTPTCAKCKKNHKRCRHRVFVKILDSPGNSVDTASFTLTHHRCAVWLRCTRRDVHSLTIFLVLM